MEEFFARAVSGGTGVNELKLKTEGRRKTSPQINESSSEQPILGAKFLGWPKSI